MNTPDLSRGTTLIPPLFCLACMSCLLPGLETGNHLRLHPQVQTVAVENQMLINEMEIVYKIDERRMLEGCF